MGSKSEVQQAYRQGVTDPDHIVAVLAAYVDAQEHIVPEQMNLAIEKYKQSNETNDITSLLSCRCCNV